jgi:5-methylcytosine-specific restriction enzyme A
MPRRIPFCRPARLPSSGNGRTADKSERDKFYAGTKWRKLRAAFLKENPLCAACSLDGLLTAATVVHHKVERLEDPDLALDWDNLEGLCSPHHTSHHKRRHP